MPPVTVTVATQSNKLELECCHSRTPNPKWYAGRLAACRTVPVGQYRLESALPGPGRARAVAGPGLRRATTVMMIARATVPGLRRPVPGQFPLALTDLLAAADRASLTGSESR
jgi:hypothetical protein